MVILLLITLAMLTLLLMTIICSLMDSFKFTMNMLIMNSGLLEHLMAQLSSVQLLLARNGFPKKL